MKLGNHTIGQQLTLVAEAGSTTRGNPQIAKQLASAAKDAGADAIKFILSNPDELIASQIDYDGQDLAEVIRSYQIDNVRWFNIIEHCKKIELPYFFSVGTCDYIGLAESLGNPIYKISGHDSRNYYLFDAILKTGKPMMFDICSLISGEVQNILDYIADRKSSVWVGPHEREQDANICFVYESHSENLDEINLDSISYLKERFGLPIGYSADWRDNAPDMWAVKNGACLIEKRIKLDDTESHHSSKALNPDEFKDWVQLMRNPTKIPWTFSEEKQAVGEYGLRPSLTDLQNRDKYFVSLVFDRDIKQGETITKEMLAARRPGRGLSPIYQYLFLDKITAKDFKKNDTLTYESVI